MKRKHMAAAAFLFLLSTYQIGAQERGAWEVTFNAWKALVKIRHHTIAVNEQDRVRQRERERAAWLRTKAGWAEFAAETDKFYSTENQ